MERSPRVARRSYLRAHLIWEGGCVAPICTASAVLRIDYDLANGGFEGLRAHGGGVAGDASAALRGAFRGVAEDALRNDLLTNADLVAPVEVWSSGEGRE